MNRHFSTGAFLVGVVALVWVGIGFIGSNIQALVITAIIGAVYAFGALELRRFRHATFEFLGALSTIPGSLQNLEDWLGSVPTSLQSSVRMRIEGERAGLPGPALTPYLVGFLVMLGMLGTFLGMVVTLNGAVFALEGTTDLQAIRSAFSAPIKGLGLAFGTSVAGVATSAMLGLMSALSRRERMMAAQLLDARIATTLRSFSLPHQRQESLKALQLQSQTLPAVVDQLQAMMSQMERMSQQLNERLIVNQDSFHSHVRGVYTALAMSVDKSLRESMMQSAHVAAESIKPVVETAMAGIAHEATVMHERLAVATHTQLDALTARLSATANTAAQSLMETLKREWSQAGAQTLAQQQEICSTLVDTAHTVTAQIQTSASATLVEISRAVASSEILMHSRVESEANWTKQHGERMNQVANLFRDELGALREAEMHRGNAAVERLGELQSALTRHLTTLGTALEDPINRLIQTAAEAPRAAADVIGQLRSEISISASRDNALLEERGRIMETLSSLLDAINHASVEQRSVIDSLVASSALTLNHASSQYSNQVDAQAAMLTDIAAHVTSSAVEVSSLGETFRFAVGSFNDVNEKLIVSLQRIEGALDKSMARSDDQLGYYVAQAREIIDLSLMSQKEICEELRQLPGKYAVFANGVSNG
ncbi:MAG: hypothetical protein WCH60_10215 [Burkholderiales bacterium]